MFTIDISLKMTPMPASIQRKNQEDAEAVYQQVLEAMRTGSPDLLELTCEQVPNKRVTLRSSEINAVQIYQKSGTSAASGRAPGFAGILSE